MPKFSEVFGLMMLMMIMITNNKLGTRRVESGVEIINMPTYHLTNSLLVLSQQLQTWRQRETLSLCRRNVTAVCSQSVLQ